MNTDPEQQNNPPQKKHNLYTILKLNKVFGYLMYPVMFIMGLIMLIACIIMPGAPFVASFMMGVEKLEDSYKKEVWLMRYSSLVLLLVITGLAAALWFNFLVWNAILKYLILLLTIGNVAGGLLVILGYLIYLLFTVKFL